MTQTDRVDRRPKMVDVGRAAGVSAQTVSRYFTGTGYVSAETRERIEQAIRELGYTFNRAARDLRVKSTQTVGVLSIGAPVYGAWAVMSGLNRAAQGAQFGLVTSEVELEAWSDAEASAAMHEALERLLAARVDGIVVSSQYTGIEEQLEGVWEKLPVVILAGGDWPHADTARIDSCEAGMLATTHLLDLGHRSILHVGGPEGLEAAAERERGYRQALARAGVDPLPVVRGDWSSASGERCGLDVDPDSFSAVFAANDQMALGVMSALRARGRNAPLDFSIVGVDDMPDARFFAPPLTTVFMDLVGLGRAGFEMITERIRTGERVPPRVIRPTLVVRESTAPHPAN